MMNPQKLTPEQIIQRQNANPNMNIAIQLDIKLILESFRQITIFPVEAPAGVNRQDCALCSTLGFSVSDPSTNVKYNPDHSFLQIVSPEVFPSKSGSAPQYNFVNIVPPLDFIPQVCSTVYTANDMFTESIRSAAASVNDDPSRNVYMKDVNLEEFILTNTNRDKIRIAMNMLFVCTKCGSVYIASGMYAPTGDEVLTLIESINKQVERAMLANGMRTPTATKSGIILPK